MRSMDVIRELNRTAERISPEPLPVTWRSERALADVASFGVLISEIRGLGRRSDDILRALARLAAGGERDACLVVTVALMPLLIALCGRRPGLIREAINELAARMVEPAEERVAGKVANRLLRRVMWRVRHSSGERTWQLSLADPAQAVTVGADSFHCFESQVVDRLAVEEFRRRLRAQPEVCEALAALLELTERSGLSSTERSRLAKHRRTVRPLAASVLVA